MGGGSGRPTRAQALIQAKTWAMEYWSSMASHVSPLHRLVSEGPQLSRHRLAMSAGLQSRGQTTLLDSMPQIFMVVVFAYLITLPEKVVHLCRPLLVVLDCSGSSHHWHHPFQRHSCLGTPAFRRQASEVYFVYFPSVSYIACISFLAGLTYCLLHT